MEFLVFFIGTLSSDDAELKQNHLVGNGISQDGWCQTDESFCVTKRVYKNCVREFECDVFKKPVQR